ncbi:MAG TPA: FCD domain-containing protein [Promineifilum sp.]
MRLEKLDSEFLKYLIAHHAIPGDRLPALTEIGDDMGVSVGKLREELAVAREMGLVSVRPRLGIQREPFDFAEAILPPILFSLATGEASFSQLSRLRQMIEVSFWEEAVVLLTPDDKAALAQLIRSAWAKLRGDPIHIPNGEHRQLHLTIFSRLDNPFVQGFFVAYWDAYDASELTRFMRYRYWVDVWTFHERIVEALCANDFERGRRLLIEHFSLLPAGPATGN